MIIGSANLTPAGLNNNIEAGMLLDFDKAEIDKIEMLFAASLTDYPSHIVKVANIADLDELLATGRLIDENAESSSPDSFAYNGANYADDREPDIDRDSDGITRTTINGLRCS